MKTLKTLSIVLFLVALVAVNAVPAQAQTATTKTYLTTALGASSSANVLAVASVTGMTASTSSNQTFVFAGLEQMLLVSINSTALTITVRRNAKGFAAPHPAFEPVYFGAPATFNPGTGNVGGGPGNPSVGGGTLPPIFIGVDPTGQCTRGSNPYLPVINPSTGNIWDCIVSPPIGSPTAAAATTAEWTAVNLIQAANSRPYKKLAVSATTYTALPTDYIIGVNTNVAVTVTLPALTGFVGKEYIIQQENTSTISLTVASSSGQTINGTTSIIIGQGTGAATPLTYMGVTIYSDGQNWFARRSSN